MAKVTIRFTTDVFDDLDYIKAYYSSPKAADKRVKAVFDRVEDLKQFPLMGRPLPELQDENIRYVNVMGEYRLIYHVIDEFFLMLLRVYPYGKSFNPDIELNFDY